MLHYLGTDSIDIAKNEATWCHTEVWDGKGVPTRGRDREIGCSYSRSAGQTPLSAVVADHKKASTPVLYPGLAWVLETIPSPLAPLALRVKN